jgi:glycosyltransferase involved in cell wall biosynthesis
MYNLLKGLNVLLKALKQLQVDRDWWLVTVGSDPRGAGRAYPGPYLGLGFVNDDARLNLAYNAADVVALPSLAENHPLVLLEALAAGAPAAAFDVGGASEITRHEQTGYVARYGEADDLARGLAWIMADADRRATLSRSCRALAEAEFDEALMVERYLALYEEAKHDDRRRTTDD